MTVLLLQHLCKSFIEAGVQCKCSHLIFYQLYCKKRIHHLQLKVAELQQLILVSRILQLLVQTVVFCFRFLYLTETCKIMTCVTVARTIKYLVSSS